MMKVGVLGAGQLGRMLARAGIPLGMEFRFLDPADGIPVRGLGVHVRADYDDPNARRDFIDGLDVVTWEFENVSLESVRWMAGRCTVHPPPDALRLAGDRLTEKTFFVDQGVPVPPFRFVNTRGDLVAAAADIGLPLVVKTRRFGYDGKGQMVIRTDSDLETAWNTLGRSPLLAEAMVAFDREVSLISARFPDGRCVFYPLVENHHRGGILRLSIAPSPDVPASVTKKAHAHGRKLLEAMGYVGVLAIEFFLVGKHLLANEMAPRVHNSGHWTMNGAVTSQFENHLRAVAGMEPGPIDLTGHSAMINLIGDTQAAENLPTLPGRHLHTYDKEPRPGRKVGHINLVADSEEKLAALLESTAAELNDPELNTVLGKRPPG